MDWSRKRIKSASSSNVSPDAHLSSLARVSLSSTDLVLLFPRRKDDNPEAFYTHFQNTAFQVGFISSLSQIRSDNDFSSALLAGIDQLPGLPHESTKTIVLQGT